jgi:hypothetical protein
MATTTSRPELQDGQVVTSGRWRASGRVRVFAAGDADVEASGRARVFASGQARVAARDDAATAASDDADINLPGVSAGQQRAVSMGCSSVYTYSSGSRVDAYGQALVRAGGSPLVRGPQVTAGGRTSVNANLDALVSAGGRSRVEARNSARVSADDDAFVVAIDRVQVQASGRSTINKFDQAVVVRR